MKGFLRRDWSLLRLNLWFYMIFILFVSLLTIFSKASAGFINTYVILFSTISVMNLFAYDEANHWQAYAAAVPDGRKAMVDARYILAVCIGVVVMVIQFVVQGLSWASLPMSVPVLLVALAGASMYGGIFFCYTAITLPVFYRFGSAKSRLVLIIIAAAFVGAMVGTSSLVLMQNTFPRYFLGVGVAAMLVSWPISRAIVRGKEY